MIWEILVPLMLAGVSCFALAKKQDVYTNLITGAGAGIHTLVSVLPALVLLLTAVHMLRASGAIDSLAHICAPLFALLGIPPELTPLLLIRPISGSAALAIGADLIACYGPDSEIGRTAAVMLGATETTFYTISVYFGAAGVHRTRYCIPAALIADLTGFVMAGVSVRLLF